MGCVSRWTGAQPDSGTRPSLDLHATDTCASYGALIVGGLTHSSKVMHMFVKFFSVKKILDALFDDGWCSLGLPEADDQCGQQFAEQAP